MEATVKKSTAIVICTALTLISALASCAMPEDEGANANKVVTGSITVPDSTYWANLKLGLFSGGDAGAYPDLDTDYGDINSVQNFRLIFSRDNDGSAVSIPKVAGTTYSISGSGATSRSYSFELPGTVPGEDITYHYVAWLDADGDGAIDLKDESWMDPDLAAAGEYNRCAVKATFDTYDNPTTIAIEGFMQSQDPFSGDFSGNYKYDGWDGHSYNEQYDLDEDNNSGFNFTIAANSGW